MPRGRVRARLRCRSGRVHSRVVVGGISIERIVPLVRVSLLRHFVLRLLTVMIVLVGWSDVDLIMRGERVDVDDGCFFVIIMFDVTMEE